jgi:small subunit ribosomal protein S2
VIAIADTNADPDVIDYPIPGNDDAIRSVSLITGAIADAIEQARREMPDDAVREDEGGVTYSTELGAQEVEERPGAKKPKRRPKRRRPRPEAIAQVRTAGGEATGGETERDEAERGEAKEPEARGGVARRGARGS